MMAPRKTNRQSSAPERRFDTKLILNQWLLGLFGVSDFEDIAKHLRDEPLEGLDDHGIHRFHQALCLHLPSENRPGLPDETLLAHDEAIVSVTKRLNQQRLRKGEPEIVWKYFQYMALLFTEIYLEHYFLNPEGLREALNRHIEAYNGQVGPSDRIEPFDTEGDPKAQLNKLAFWMATGSGKTLLMHAHVRQYQRHLEKHGRRGELNKIILVTPNEGLSEQHLREFEKSGIQAEIFNKEKPSLFMGEAVQVLEITKLKEEGSKKTVSVESFEGNNLVLVDEGHRGASAGDSGPWMGYRNALCEQGFSFEYSATFGQAVKGNKNLTNLYTRCILFDYSYRWFYNDGFGKDYQILNLEDDRDEGWVRAYMTACLLAFYQQLRLYQKSEPCLRPFHLERPLWVFVGGSVTAKLSSKDATDIVKILTFLKAYCKERQESVRCIERVLHEGLMTASGRTLFPIGFFRELESAMTPERVYADTLTAIFNAPEGGGLYLENIKGATGEVALRIGDNEPFGVINVGDDAGLVKLCRDQGFDTREREFSSGSLFHGLDRPDSEVHLLIGSKKFTEGWSSWRVSTMGLMHVGKKEGAQIIQLFGRGVRLKGFQMSLKRSNRLSWPMEGVEPPGCIRKLETLHIFGIRADYMRQFREFLEEEGVRANEEREELIIPVILDRYLETSPALKTIGLKEKIGGVRAGFGDAFRRLGPIPTLLPPGQHAGPAGERLLYSPLELNWYPKVQALASEDGAKGIEAGELNQTCFTKQHVAFLDIEKLFFDLERFKAERGWHNLNITLSGIQGLLENARWYKLYIPEAEMAFDSMEKVARWQEITLALLKKYTERYYTLCKREWEMPHLEYRDLTRDDPNFPRVSVDGQEKYGYRVVVEAESPEGQAEVVAKLKELQEAIERGRLEPWKYHELEAFVFEDHLYRPLLYAHDKTFEITPAPLNKGESQFIQDLKAFCETRPNFLQEKRLFLLRNLSRGHGVGFFEAGNFYPDFILWLLEGDKQHVAFIDPKGLRQVGKGSPKARFYETIKEVERRLNNPRVSLDAYLVSNTSSQEMEVQWGCKKAEMQAMHILFQEDKDRYIEEMMNRLVG